MTLHGHRAYRQSLSDAMTGRWHVPPTQWVFLLCGAYTVMLCNPRATGLEEEAFEELHVNGIGTENGQIQATDTADICLVRWCHRVQCKALVPVTDRNKAAGELIDPLATAGGCDGLMWARQGEVRSPPGLQQLNNTIAQNVKAYHEATLADSTQSDAQAAGSTDKRAKAVAGARNAIRQYSNAVGRYRADDAFSGKAYCDIQECGVGATPVAVLPDFAYSKVKTSWTVDVKAHAANTDAYNDLQAFEKTQAFLLSNYNRLRLQLLINPRHSGVEM